MFLSRDEAREYMRTYATEYLRPDRVSERSGIIKDWTFTISNNNNYYIDNVVYYKINNATIEKDNDSNICSITTSN